MNGAHIDDICDSAPGGTAGRHASRLLLVLNVAVKLVLVGLLIFSLAAPDLPQFAG